MLPAVVVGQTGQTSFATSTSEVSVPSGGLMKGAGCLPCRRGWSMILILGCSRDCEA